MIRRCPSRRSAGAPGGDTCTRMSGRASPHVPLSSSSVRYGSASRSASATPVSVISGPAERASATAGQTGPAIGTPSPSAKLSAYSSRTTRAGAPPLPPRPRDRARIRAVRPRGSQRHRPGCARVRARRSSGRRAPRGRTPQRAGARSRGPTTRPRPATPGHRLAPAPVEPRPPSHRRAPNATSARSAQAARSDIRQRRCAGLTVAAFIGCVRLGDPLRGRSATCAVWPRCRPTRCRDPCPPRHGFR